MKIKFAVFIVVIVLLVIGIGVFTNKSQGPGKFDEFAQALKSGGAEFYGAFWCPHCQAQKAMFGKSAQYLPYTECSTPDGQGQLQVCKDHGITTYPTWFFPTGSTTPEIVTGEIELVDLAERTSCVLPE